MDFLSVESDRIGSSGPANYTVGRLQHDVFGRSSVAATLANRSLAGSGSSLSRCSTWIHMVRANQFFTKDLFLRVFLQTNSAIERRNVQAVFVWRYLPPFGTVQVAYQRGTAAFGERSDQGNTLFVKATTVL